MARITAVLVPLSLYCCRLRVPGSWHSHGCSCPVRYLKEVAPLLGLVHTTPIGPGVAFHLDCCLSRASQFLSSASIRVGRKGARDRGVPDCLVYEQQLTLPLSSSVQLLVASLHALSHQVDCGTIHGPSTLAVTHHRETSKEKGRYETNDLMKRALCDDLRVQVALVLLRGSQNPQRHCVILWLRAHKPNATVGRQQGLSWLGWLTC